MSIESLSSHSLEASMDEAAPRPRLCHLKKWPDFQGYGFNLHAERTKLQQQIGKVDSDSPAESAGLKEKDRIIEVNFVNISNENHQQVVKRIRNGLEIDQALYPDQVVLLVLDPEADEYYKKINLVVRHDMPNVLKLTTADPPKQQEHQVVEDPVQEESVETPIEEAVDEQVEEQVEDKVEVQVEEQVEEQVDDQVEEKNDEKENESIEQRDELVNNGEDGDVAKVSDVNNNEQVNKTATNSASSLVNSQETSPLNKSKISNNSSVSTSPVQSQNSTLNRSSSAFAKDEIFKMSAAEFKSYLKSKGRNDPRVMSLDMKRKHEIFQNM